MITIREIEQYKDFGKVVSIDNGTIEAYVTVDVGPRIIRFGFIGGQNIMQDDRKTVGGKTDESFEAYYGEGKQWENLGGHRIWLSPEHYPASYYPDLEPVQYKADRNGSVGAVCFCAAPEWENSILKEMIVSMSDEHPESMAVSMSISNVGDRPMRFSVWGLTVSAQGGTEIIPMNTDDTGLLSNRTVMAWPYTDMGDGRVTWMNRYVTLKQDPDADGPFKLGFDLKGGKVHYLLNGEIFTKCFSTYHPDAEYPDNGCSFETYTNPAFIEIESLSPLCDVTPGSRSEMSELWTLKKSPVKNPDLSTDEAIDRFLEQL